MADSPKKSLARFGKVGRGAALAIGLAVIVAALTVGGIGISNAVHHSQDAGLDGVYEASDGFADLTFWPNGTYVASGMGLTIPGKYEVRNNGTVDMNAQLKSILHPGPNASHDAQVKGTLYGMFAQGIGEGLVSPDKNTFQWQDHTFSYDHKPTTDPSAVPDADTADPNAPDSSSGSAPSGTTAP